MIVSHQYQHEVFAYVKLLHLRALFWEKVNTLKKKYGLLHQFPLEFFLQFKILLESPYFFTERDIDNILNVQSDNYSTPGNVEYCFDDFKNIFFHIGTLRHNDFIRIKEFLKSNKKRLYTIDYIKQFVTRSELWLRYRRIERNERNNKEYNGYKKYLERKIKDIVKSINRFKKKIQELEKEIDCFWSEEKISSYDHYDYLSEVYKSKLNKRKQLFSQVESMTKIKNDLENRYLELISV